MRIKDFKNCCRICLSIEFQRDITLMEELFSNMTILDCIKNIFNICLEVDDIHSDKICKNCYLELQSAKRFKEKCEKSNTIFMHMINIKDDNVIKVLGDTATEYEVNAKQELVSLPVNDSKPLKFKEESSENEYNAEYNYIEIDTKVKYEFKGLEQNNKTHTSETVKKSRAIDLKLICNECGGSFKSKCKLSVHWKKKHLTESLTCQTCRRAFHATKAYKNHIGSNACKKTQDVTITGIGKYRIFHCKYCDYKSKKLQSTMYHTFTHSGKKNHTCDICNKSFVQISSLIGHRQNVHKINVLKTTCQYCGKSITGSNSLYKHLQTHRNNHHECPICKKILKTKQILKNHLLSHSSNKRFTCEFCAKSFSYFCNLSTHKAIHHNNRTYNCDICGYKSKSNYRIRKHKKGHDIKNIVCILCGRFFDDEESLKKHKQRHDKSRKLFTCSVCSNSYARKDGLVKHMKTKHKEQYPPNSLQSVKNIKQEKLPTCNNDTSE